MLRHTVQRPFDAIDPLERGRQPGIDLGVEHDIWRRSRRKGCSRLGEQDLGHCDGVPIDYMRRGMVERVWGEGNETKLRIDFFGRSPRQGKLCCTPDRMR